MLILHPINAIGITGTWLAIWGICFLPKPLRIARQAGWRVNWRRWGAFAAVVVPVIFVINCLWILTGWGLLIVVAYNGLAVIVLDRIAPQQAFILTTPQAAWGDALLRLARVADAQRQWRLHIRLQTADRKARLLAGGTSTSMLGLGMLLILEWGARHGSTPEDATV